MTRVSSTIKRLSKKDLVKLFTMIPHDFVDDFFDILDTSSSTIELFSVSLDVIAKWLGVPKGKLMETLKESYIENEHYIVRQAPRPISTTSNSNRGGHNYKLVLLTIDTFKRLCMRSRSKKAEDVRTYFIELDNFVTMYTERILIGLLTKLNKARNKNGDGSGWIYIFRLKDDIFKLGQTQNLIDRLRAYNTGRIDDVEILASLQTKNRKQVEQCVKTFVQSKRFKKRKELYEVDEDIIKRVMRLCVQLGDSNPPRQWTIKRDHNYYIFIDDRK